MPQKHIVLFYEEAEYARMILFKFLNSGLIQKNAAATFLKKKLVQLREKCVILA
jgi:hypothetical protein